MPKEPTPVQLAYARLITATAKLVCEADRIAGLWCDFIEAGHIDPEAVKPTLSLLTYFAHDGGAVPLPAMSAIREGGAR